MAKRSTADQRRQFFVRHLKGETYEEIAEATGFSYECVRNWCRRQRDGDSVETHYYRPSQGALSEFGPQVRYVILRLRLEHPGWGPGRIRFHLLRRQSLSGLALPSVSSIGRYLHQWQRFRRRPRVKGRRKRPAQPSQVHQRWQLDFKEGIELEEGIQVNMHTVRDPMGAACLQARMTESGAVGGRGKRVTLAQLRQTLRQTFTCWGTLPEEVQTDNEPLFVGHTADNFPSLFTLWLSGLGIRHLTIRPGISTDNAEVERCHRTLFDYALDGQLHLPFSQLQQKLEQAVQELTFHLPSQANGCNGLSPVQAHPQLLSQPRPFLPEQELALFSQERVDAFLATFTWRRKVGKTGQICIGGHHRYYSVGRAYARQYVLVRFDPQDRHFVFYPDQALADGEKPTGDEIARRPARHLSVADITALTPDSSTYVPQQLALDLQIH